MKTIYKYKLQIKDEQCIGLPEGAKILTVQVQKGEAFIWALVDNDKDLEERFIEVIGTGNPVTGSDSRNYIGTIQLNDGNLVFHVFEYTGV